MNKTIIININGIVFHIEEEAYEVLRVYMTDIKRHFAYSVDSDEIVTDIENRLAEMFNEHLASQGKQVIVQQDVEEITAQMGSVKDFASQEQESETFDDNSIKIERKLFRDPDDRSVAGVCAGLGHYFDIEIKWVRIAFVLSVLLSGVGLFAYAVLWAILPEARTRQEKMAMKGEPINLQNFKKNFDEEVEAIKQNFNNPNFQRTGDSIGDFVSKLANIILSIFKVFVKIIGGIIVLSGAAALFGLIIALLFSLGFWNHKELNEFPFNVINPEFKSQLYFSAFILLIIPLIALILFALRVLFNKILVSKTASFAMLILWLTGLSMGVYYGSKIAADFKEEARFEQRQEFTIDKPLHLNLNPNKLLTKEDSLVLHLDNGSFEGSILVDDDETNIGHVTKFNLNIEKSESDKAFIIKEFGANGGTFETALEAAQNIKYRLLQNDSTITFDKYLYLTKNSPYRGQRLKITLKVPVNTRLLIAENLGSHLHNFNIWECKPENSPHQFIAKVIMTDEGLKCLTDSLTTETAY